MKAWLLLSFKLLLSEAMVNKTGSWMIRPKQIRFWAFLIIYLRFLDFGLGTSFRDEFSMIPIKQRRSHLYNNNVLVARGFDGIIVYKICLISNY